MNPGGLLAIAALLGIAGAIGLLWHRRVLRRHGAESEYYRHYVDYNRFVWRLWLVAVPAFILAALLSSGLGC